MSKLILHGARENNLKDVDLELPLGRWISVLGPSGSGKTSLVHQTLLREGQRRYLSALSPKARLQLGKLGRADLGSIQGLPVTLSVGERALSASARSTVGTLSGALDLLRLLFARVAVDPGGEALTRSHFSFNHPLGACPACAGLGVEDQVDPELLVVDSSKTIRQGALRPTLKSGYTVYSQVTVDVMDRICRAHGFDVDTPWAQLTPEQVQVVFFGTQVFKVPFGKHSIESRMKWSGITARPREEGYYRGLVPVIRETLKRDRNPNILRFVRSVACSVCAGSRLARIGRQAQLSGHTPLAGHTLPAFLALPIRELLPVLEGLPGSAAWHALAPSLMGRLERLSRLGLGHLSLGRESTTLSGGEGQRVRLAAQISGGAGIAGGLGGMLVALDEPTLGLHPESQAGMAQVLEELREAGNTLLVVEHDPDMVRYAEHLVVLGPGAGPQGGEVLRAGPIRPGEAPLGETPAAKACPRAGKGVIRLSGATLNGLEQADLDVQMGCFNLVAGPSGAGKSSLVFGTLLPALNGERGGSFETLSGVPKGLAVRAVDAKPIGRTPRSTPATWSGLFDLVRKRFAGTSQAKKLGLSASHFSFNSKAGRCATCQGLGVRKVGLHLLEDLELECSDCGGGRYAEQVLAVTLGGRDIAQTLRLSMEEAREVFAQDPPIAQLCQAMVDLGLGYLRLGQSSTTLSRGEGQRVKLATWLAKSGPALLLMDEPDRGLHPQDVVRLLQAIDALVERGSTVLAISHHRALWAAADHRVTLRAGRVVPTQPLNTSPLQASQGPRALSKTLDSIRLRGVRTHNLKGLDVDIPHRKLSVVVGPSGSGKSSLAFDTVAALAWGRFSETLPFQIRRFMRRLPQPDLDSAQGLTPVVALRQRKPRLGSRSTVATQSGLGPLLRLLWSRAGKVDGQPSGLSAGDLSPDRALGACPLCEGLGVVQRCTPVGLMTHPELPIAHGAMKGTKPGQFFGEHDGQYMATLQAVLPGVDLSVSWQDLPQAAQQVALYGAGEQQVSVRWKFQRGERAGEHQFEGTWPGLCHLVENEASVRGQRKSGAAWRAPLQDQPCPDCSGQRLGPRGRAVLLAGMSLPQCMARPLEQLPGLISELKDPVVQALLPELHHALDDLLALGLGHLRLDRRSDSLSGGELQRLRLSGMLQSGLSQLTLVLDEPCAGLDEPGVLALIQRLRGLVAQGNTVLVVEHRPSMIAAADHVIELGPGAGPLGGELLHQGPANQVLAGQGPTAVALRAPQALAGRVGAPGVFIQGCTAPGLQGQDLSLAAWGLVALTGPSGSGKSSLMQGVLQASFMAGKAVGCADIQGLERFMAICSSGSGSAGSGSAGSGSLTSPLDALRLMAPLQKAFAKAGAEGGVAKRAFSFRSPAGRCPACHGSGVERVAMDALADLELICVVCDGRRYRPEVLAVSWQGLSVDALLGMPAAELVDVVPCGALREGTRAMCRVGLGHLSLGRRGSTLSGGEAQRLRLAASLLLGKHPTLHLLEEPGRGLHEADLEGLLEILSELGEKGDLVVVSTHRKRLISSAGQVLVLG